MNHRITVFDIPFDPITKANAVEQIGVLLKQADQHIVVTPNPEMVLESLHNNELKKTLQQSSLSLADGTGILWATTFLSLHSKHTFHILYQYAYTLLQSLYSPKSIRNILPERVTGSDSFLDICSMCEQKNYSIFLLGGSDGIAERTKEILIRKFPHISIVGTYAGYPFTEDDQIIIQEINQSKPSIVFVAFGTPKQEIWMRQYLQKTPSVKVIMGIGGTFDFVSGSIQRAPQWMRKMGLEWLWRLFQEPRKRFPRIWNAVIVFPLTILRYKLKQHKNLTHQDP